MTTETILTEEQIAEIWNVSNKPFGDDFKQSHYFFAWNIVAAMLDSPEIQALRKDAERYRWLRRGAIEDVAVARGLYAMDYGSSAVVPTYSEELVTGELDEVIDAAMEQQK